MNDICAEPLVSIIIPTKNNELTINECLKSIFNLNYQKNEIIIVDGHSTDNTVLIASRYNTKTIYENKGTRAGACNEGIKIAEGDIIAFTDADCTVSKTWLSDLISSLDRDKGIVCVTGPNAIPPDLNGFSKAVGLALSTPLGGGTSTHAKVLMGKKIVKSAPGCNAAYYRDVYDEIGLFDESLITAEDAELNQRLRDFGNKILYVPSAKVFHYHRTTLRAFFKQIYRYAIGRAQLLKKNRKSLGWLHILPSLELISIIVLLILSLQWPILFKVTLGLIISYFIVILAFSTHIVIKNSLSFKMYSFLVFIFIIEFFGWSLGFIRGLLTVNAF
jgi:cellulose synthase/poly-beta-1,6-N-acetylglucosamine synthase-like glycosyltransferase